MAQYLPVEIDTVTQNNLQPSNPGAGPGSNEVELPGPIKVGSHLYIPLGRQNFNGPFQMWKSVDGGATWNVQGAPISCRSWAVDFRAGIFTIAYLTNVLGNQAITLIQFDTSTDTYGATFGVGAMSTSCVMSLRVRSNGDIVVLHDENTGGNAIYWGSIWNGAWTNKNFDLTGTTEAQSISSCIDSLDNIHILTSFSAGVAYNVHYWRLDTTNTFNGPQAFVWVSASGMGQGAVPNISVSDASDTVYVFQDRNAQTVQGFYGSPRSAPVWSSLTTGVQVGTLAGATIVQSPTTTIGTDGFVYVTINDNNQFCHVLKAPLSPVPINFSNDVVLDTTLTSPSLTNTLDHPKIATVGITPSLYFNAALSSGPGPLRFLLGTKGIPLMTKSPVRFLSVPRPLPWPYNT